MHNTRLGPASPRKNLGLRIAPAPSPDKARPRPRSQAAGPWAQDTAPEGGLQNARPDPFFALFRTSAEFWINLQGQYDLKEFEASEEAAEIARDVQPRRAATR
jgi:hypothetical protein